MPMLGSCCVPKGYYITFNGVTACACQNNPSSSTFKSFTQQTIGDWLGITLAIPGFAAGAGIVLTTNAAALPVPFAQINGRVALSCAGGSNILNYTHILSVFKAGANITLFTSPSTVIVPKGQYWLKAYGNPSGGNAVGDFYGIAPSITATPQTFPNLISCGSSGGQLVGVALLSGGSADVEAVFGNVTLAASSISLNNASHSGQVLSFTSSPGSEDDSRWVAAPGQSGFSFCYTGYAPLPLWLHFSTALVGDGLDDLTGNFQQSITYSVDANGTGSARSGFIFVNDQKFTINQAA